MFPMNGQVRGFPPLVRPASKRMRRASKSICDHSFAWPQLPHEARIKLLRFFPLFNRVLIESCCLRMQDWAARRRETSAGTSPVFRAWPRCAPPDSRARVVTARRRSCSSPAHAPLSPTLQARYSGAARSLIRATLWAAAPISPALPVDVSA
jgi:hypothetical protein